MISDYDIFSSGASGALEDRIEEMKSQPIPNKEELLKEYNKIRGNPEKEFNFFLNTYKKYDIFFNDYGIVEYLTR